MRLERYRELQSKSSGHLALRLRTARERNQLSQAQFAEMLGVTDRSIRNYETGSRIDDDLIAKWSRLTGFPLSWFFREEGD